MYDAGAKALYSHCHYLIVKLPTGVDQGTLWVIHMELSRNRQDIM